MSKKSSLPLIYLIGMALVVIGFICPIFQKSMGPFGTASWNGFDFINIKDEISFVTLGAILILAGAVAGVVFSLIKNEKMLKAIALIVSVVGLVVLYLGCNDSKIYTAIAKHFIKIATFGFYMIVAGWVISAVGLITNK